MLFKHFVFSLRTVLFYIDISRGVTKDLTSKKESEKVLLLFWIIRKHTHHKPLTRLLKMDLVFPLINLFTSLSSLSQKHVPKITTQFDGSKKICTT